MSGLVGIATYGLKVLTVGMSLSGNGFLNCPNRADVESVFSAYRAGGKANANTQILALHRAKTCTSSFDGLTIADKPVDTIILGEQPNHDTGYLVRALHKDGERWIMLLNTAVADELPAPHRHWTTPHEDISTTSFWTLMGEVDACKTKEDAIEVIEVHRKEGFVAARKRMLELENVKDAAGEPRCFPYEKRIRFLGKPIIDEPLPYFGRNVRTSVIEAEARWDNMNIFVIITNAEFKHPSEK